MVDSKTITNLGIIVAIVIVIVLAAIFLMQNKGGAAYVTTQQSSVAQQTTVAQGNNTTQQSTSTVGQETTVAQSNAIKLAGSIYASQANLVYAPGMSSPKYVAAGFNISIKSISGANVSVTLSALSNRLSNSTFVLPKNDSLYYVDASLGDDSAPSGEYSLSDDHVAIVNASGYIVNNVQASAP